MKAFVLAALAALLISGCAHDSQLAKAQADATAEQARARTAEAQAAAEESKAVQALAAKIDATGASNYLLVKALKGLGLGQAPVQQVAVQQPQSILGMAWQSLLQVADVGLRAYGIKVAGDVAMTNSNNSRDTSVASYGAFTAMGNSIANAGTAGYQYIQAPAANVTNTTLSGTGVLGSGTYTGPVTTTTNRNCSGGSGASGGAGVGAIPGGAGGSGAGGTC